MSLDQNIRFRPANIVNTLNPQGLYSYLIVPTALVGVGVPSDTLNPAVLNSTYIDSSTGQEYTMNEAGHWVTFVNYSSFSVVPDPLTIQGLNVDTIKGDTTESVHIDLGVAGSLSVGPHTALSRVQVLSDGSIITNSATSTVIVADGGGNQTGYGPQSIVSDNLMNVTSQNAMQFNSNTAGISLNPATDLTLNPGGVVRVSQQVLSTGLGPQYADAAGTSGLQVGAGIATLKGFGGGQITAFGAGLSTTGDIFPINPSVYKVGDNTGNKFLDVASDNAHFSNTFLDNGAAATPSYTFKSSTNDGLYLAAPGQVSIAAGGVQMLQVSSGALFVGSSHIDAPSGTVGLPGYSFAGDTTSGLYLNGAGNPVMAASGAAVMGFVSGQVNTMASIIPTAAATFNLASNALPFNNIFSQNAVTVVSDERLKENITEIDERLGLDFVKSLKPVFFNWKDTPEDKVSHLGFIAQHLEKSLIDKAFTRDSFDLVKYSSENDKYHITSTALLAPIVKAIQELADKYSKIEERMSAFEILSEECDAADALAKVEEELAEEDEYESDATSSDSDAEGK